MRVCDVLWSCEECIFHSTRHILLCKMNFCISHLFSVVIFCCDFLFRRFTQCLIYCCVTFRKICPCLIAGMPPEFPILLPSVNLRFCRQTNFLLPIFPEWVKRKWYFPKRSQNWALFCQKIFRHSDRKNCHFKILNSPLYGGTLTYKP